MTVVEFCLLSTVPVNATARTMRASFDEHNYYYTLGDFMNTDMTLSTLTAMTGLDVFDYLDREVSVPVVDGMQAQGDLIGVPYPILAQSFSFTPDENRRRAAVGSRTTAQRGGR